MGDELLAIGDFGRASGLSAKALRLYDETGLLPPTEVDPWSGYRRYHRDLLRRARLVARLRLTGMPLARIREVVDADRAAAVAELTSYARQVEADAASAGALLAELVAEIDEEETTMTEHRTDQTAWTTEVAVRGGRGQRDTQEDAVHAGAGLYAVADGFGWADGFAHDLLDELARCVRPEAGLGALDAAVGAAGERVAARRSTTPDAGSTLTALLLGGSRVLVAHLGDSRAYRVRDGHVERLTRDHTVTQTLLDEGRITAEEARHDERRVRLNRAVAVEASVVPDLISQGVAPGDRYVLTTDGVHGELEPADLSDLLVASAPPEDIVAAVAAAVEETGADDNYQVLVVDVD